MDRLSWHNCPDLLYQGASFLYETRIRRCSGRTPEARLCDVAALEKAQRERHLGFHPRLHLSSEKLSKLLFLLSFVACLVAGGRDVHLSVIMRLVGNDKTQLESHLEYRDKKKKYWQTTCTAYRFMCLKSLEVTGFRHSLIKTPSLFVFRCSFFLYLMSAPSPAGLLSSKQDGSRFQASHTPTVLHFPEQKSVCSTQPSLRESAHSLRLGRLGSHAHPRTTRCSWRSKTP